MKPVALSIGISSALVLLYAAAPALGLGYSLVFLLFLLANVGLFWMVYRILTKGEPSTKTWDEGYRYDDVDEKLG